MYQSSTPQHSLLIFTTFLFVSILDLTVFLSDSTNFTSQTSPSVSTDIISSSQISPQIFQQPPLNPIPVNPSLNITPINTPSHTPIKTSVPQQTQTSLTLPLSDTEFPLSSFNITPTNSPRPSLLYIPDLSDIDPLLLRNNDNPTATAPKSILIPTSIKSFCRRFQFGNSLPIPPPCSHLPSQSSLPPPKSLKILALESFDSLQKKSDFSEIDSTTFSLLYLRLPPSNSASKNTTSSLDNLLETTSESTNQIVIDITSVIILVLLLISQVQTTTQRSISFNRLSFDS